MIVKELIKELGKANPYALIMVGTVTDNGDTQMVEATAYMDLRTGDIEILPAK